MSKNADLERAQLIARHWNYSRRRPGRPRTRKDITELILKMALENPHWGYTSIRNRLRNVGLEVNSEMDWCGLMFGI